MEASACAFYDERNGKDIIQLSDICLCTNAIGRLHGMVVW